MLAEEETEGEMETRRERGEEKMTGWRRVGEKKFLIISVNLSVLLCSLTCDSQLPPSPPPPSLVLLFGTKVVPHLLL